MARLEAHELPSGILAGFWVLRCRRCGAGVAASVYAGKTSGHARRNLVRAARRRGWDTVNELCPECGGSVRDASIACLPTGETHTPPCLPG